MAILGRKTGAIAGAVFKRGHYIAAVNMLRYYQKPIDAFRRYLLGAGNYPAAVTLRTPAGAFALTLHCNHDILIF